MLDYRVRHTGWSDWLRRNRSVLGRGDRRPSGQRAHGQRRLRGPPAARRAAAGGLAAGAARAPLPLDDRRAHGPLAPALPQALRPAGARAARRPPAPSRVLGGVPRWHVERSLHAMGAATERTSRGYLTFPRFGPGGRRAALRRDASRRGEVSADRGRGRARRAGSRSRATCPRWRARPAAGARLTGHDVPVALRLAALVPRARRAPVRLRLPDRGLHAGPPARARLLHAADPPRRPADRPRRRQEPPRRAPAGGASRAPRALVRGGAGAPGAAASRLDQEAMLAGVAEAMGSLAAFVGADDIVLRRVTPRRLRAPLVRAVRLESRRASSAAAPRPTDPGSDPSPPASHP